MLEEGTKVDGQGMVIKATLLITVLEYLFECIVRVIQITF